MINWKKTWCKIAFEEAFMRGIEFLLFTLKTKIIEISRSSGSCCVKYKALKDNK
jgi:hypothetical protein